MFKAVTRVNCVLTIIVKWQVLSIISRVVDIYSDGAMHYRNDACVAVAGKTNVENVRAGYKLISEAV